MPVNCITFLGMEVNPSLQAFQIPASKKASFAVLREEILSGAPTVPLKTLQRFMGKAISFTLAFPGAKFFISEMAAAIGSASVGAVRMTSALSDEIAFWRFLDNWTCRVPWWMEKHVAVTISTEASQSRWAGVIQRQPTDIVLRDFWEGHVASEGINVKELWAVAKVLEALPSDIRDCRVNFQVDNQAVIHTWMGRGGRAKNMYPVAKRIFHLTQERNLQLTMTYVPSECNAADGFSRKLTATDSILAPQCWDKVQELFGGSRGHSLDLMSLDSNVQRDRVGRPLPHFTPYPTLGSAGVDVFSHDLQNCDRMKINAYCFPPFALIHALLCFLQSQKAIVTVVVPGQFPRPSWWPTIVAMSSRGVILAKKGAWDALLTPTKHGLRPIRLLFDLWAFRVDRF